MQLIVHRGTHEIGGTLIEVKTNQTKILVDVGRPLSKTSTCIDVAALHPDAVLISHPHQDHFGLIDQLDKMVPIYMGALGKKLICASRKFLDQDLPHNNFQHFEPGRRFEIGEFEITPYLMDHSAVDAYAFLIEAQGKRIFYSGDFRASGHKSLLFDKLVNEPPPRNIDVLLLEGTMLRRSSGEFPDEASVRRKIESVLKDQRNITFLIASSQNIDRLVACIHACQNTGKVLVLDIYTAWVLEQVSQISPKVPTMAWDQVNVYADFSLDQRVANESEFFGDFRQRLYRQRVTKEALHTDPSRHLVYSKMSRFKAMELYKQYGPINLIYSQWLGYLNFRTDQHYGTEQIAAYQHDPKVNFYYAHTSGHATLETLIKLATVLQPSSVVPIHTEFPQDYRKHFSSVTALQDGEPYRLS